MNSEQPPARQHETQCLGKVPYGDRFGAKRAITAMSRKRKRGLEPYRCPYCGNWHLGGKR